LLELVFLLLPVLSIVTFL